MYNDLNEIQIKIFIYINEHIKANGYPPSVREIMSATNLKSTSTVHKHICILEEQNYIRRDPTKPRAMEVIKYNENNDRTIQIPIVGNVTAGLPILAVENIEETVLLSSKLINEDDFILKIKGESMIEAGIYDKDYVIIRKQNSANNGDIVVALIEDEATVKRFFKEENRIRLQPENETMEPIYVDDLKILGIVKGLYRKL